MEFLKLSGVYCKDKITSHGRGIELLLSELILKPPLPPFTTSGRF